MMDQMWRWVIRGYLVNSGISDPEYLGSHFAALLLKSFHESVCLSILHIGIASSGPLCHYTQSQSNLMHHLLRRMGYRDGHRMTQSANSGNKVRDFSAEGLWAYKTQMEIWVTKTAFPVIKSAQKHMSETSSGVEKKVWGIREGKNTITFCSHSAGLSLFYPWVLH